MSDNVHVGPGAHRAAAGSGELRPAAMLPDAADRQVEIGERSSDRTG